MKASKLAFLFTGLALTVACGRSDAEHEAWKLVKVACPHGGIVRDVYFERGDRVLRGSLLLQLDDRRELCELAIAQVKFENCVVDLDASRRKRDELFSSVMARQPRLRPRDDQIPEMKRTWEQYKIEVEVAEVAVRMAYAEVEQAKAALEATRVYSPVNGIVEQVLVKPGEGAKDQAIIVLILPTR